MPNTALTVAQAVSENHNNRHGLNGLRMRHIPTNREFVCHGSSWGPGRTLMILMPGKIPRPQTRPRSQNRPKTTADSAPTEIKFATLADIEPYVGESVRADQCVFIDPWKLRRSRI